MALKDLVADANKIDEETIEDIVANYVRYDPVAFKIVFTPNGAELKNELKLLVYLVSVVGWKYLVEDAEAVPTKPSDLEAALGIGGGTLRPILKKLKDSHLVSVNDGHYTVQTANLDIVRRVIKGEKVRSARVRKSATKSTERNSSNQPRTQDAKQKKNSAGELRPLLEAWVNDGYFDEARTIRDLLERYHEHAIIVQRTSLSGLLLRAVRDGLLSRAKVETDGKRIWRYKAKSQ